MKRMNTRFVMSTGEARYIATPSAIRAVTLDESTLDRNYQGVM